MHTSLKQLLNSNELEFIMEAHNGLSAKIVQETGFKAIWASGLSMSASQGLRDANELSSSQVLNLVEYMSDAADIPILLDGDNGFGDFNNFRKLVRDLEKISIAGVCIEDKLFPKKNSFVESKHDLETISNFTGKIKAGKDTQTNNDFVIVARTEALIAGLGLDHTIERASAYADSGADAILVHSKSNDFDEIQEFMKMWNRKEPIIIVPTTYSSTPVENFIKSGISAVIWANHNLRACVNSMQKISQKIFRDKSIDNLSSEICSLQQIFELTNMFELVDAEKKYR